jgi:hypothetical protein
MTEPKKEGGIAVSEEQGKGLSISLIIIIVLLIAGGVYLLRGKDAVAPVEVVLETPTTTEPVLVENTLVTERVSKILATGLGISPDLVKVTSVTEKEWSDGCLGLGKKDEVCTQALVSGYEAKLTAQGVVYTYRTDKAVNVIKIDRSALGK